MRSLKVLILLLCLPVLAQGKEPDPLLAGEIWRSKDSQRTVTVLPGGKAEFRDGDLSALVPLRFKGRTVIAETAFFGKKLEYEFERIEGALVCPDKVPLYPSIKLTEGIRLERAKRQLMLIGRHLKALEEKEKLQYLSGAVFLLQVVPLLKDEELSCFQGLRDPVIMESMESPEPGSPAFVKRYRDLKLPASASSWRFNDWYCAYAGPNFKDYPVVRAGPAKQRRRLWACDRCPGGPPVHDGILVLWNDLTVELIPPEKIEGTERYRGGVIIQVGPHSPDERLKKMCYGSP